MAETALNRARIAVDAMGGDYAPNEIIAGSMRASEELDVEVLLVGDSERIEAYFQHHPRPKNLTIVHAEEVVAMDEEPITAIRRKPAASINVAMDLVKQNRADAVVAAGHSGAAMAAALLRLGRLKGIDRPAIGAVLPTMLAGKSVIILDVGANVDCKPKYLEQFALMGTIYSKYVMGVEDPKVGLLNMSQSRLQTDSSTHWLLCLPVSHVAGFSIVARSVLMGNPISILSKFDEAEVMNTARAGATHVSLVPTTMQRIDPSVFNTILLGGAAAPPNLPHNVVTTYGMTETFGGIAYNGKPLDGVAVRTLNENLELKSPSLFRTYRGHIADRPIGDWYDTGDKGEFANNLIRVFGRRDDMIITGGENVWPNVVEKAVATFPGVEQVVVGGINDEQWGQRVVAWIVSSRDVAPTLESIRQHVKTQLPSFCAPTELRVVQEIPMTSLGKVDTQKLRQLK